MKEDDKKAALWTGVLVVGLAAVIAIAFALGVFTPSA